MTCAPGGRGTIEATAGPLAVQASAHFYTSGDRWARMASFVVPAAKGVDALAEASPSSPPSPSTSLFQCLLGPSSDAPFFGAVAPSGSSGTATSDGFMVVTVAQSANGDRGFATLTVGATLRGACSMHYYTNGDTYYPENSFCVPITQGETWALTTTTTSGAPKFTSNWVPLQDLSMQTMSMRGAGTVYTANTDGFLVAVLNATDGGRATVQLQSAARSADLPNMPVYSCASVHFYPEHDTYLPCNAAMLPVQKGQVYQSQVIVTSGKLNGGSITDGNITATLYWVPLINPLYSLL